jgi:hypothetical protein
VCGVKHSSTFPTKGKQHLLMENQFLLKKTDMLSISVVVIRLEKTPKDEGSLKLKSWKRTKISIKNHCTYISGQL